MDNSTDTNYRLSLKFSSDDPEQVEVVEMLKKMGRKKSSFITKAVKYYIEANGADNIQPGLENKMYIKSLIREVLKEMDINYKSPTAEPAPSDRGEKQIDDISDEQMDEFLDVLDEWG